MPDPNTQLTGQFLGEIGTDVPSWLQNFLVEVRGHLQALYVNPTQPGGVLGLTITKNNLGNLISWTAPVIASGYQVFRNTSGDFITATQIAQLDGQSNVSFFDGIDQTTANQTRYYWVRAINSAGLGGPISSVATSTNFAGSSTSTFIGIDAVAPGTNGTAVGKDADSGDGSNNTIVGVSSNNADSLNAVTIVGAGSTNTAGANSTLVGQGNTSAGSDDTLVGQGITTGSGGDNTLVGKGAGTNGNTTGGVAVGRATTIGANATAIGASCSVTGDRSTGVGSNVTITHADCVVIGKGGASTAANQVVIGTADTQFTDVWFGRGVTHTGAATNLIIHTSDGSGTNVAGDNLHLYSGRSTGNVIGGSIGFYRSPAGGSGSTLGTAALCLSIPDSGGTADFALTTNGSGVGSWVSGQSIAGLKTSSTPQFARLGLAAAAHASNLLQTSGGSFIDSSGALVNSVVGPHAIGEAADSRWQVNLGGTYVPGAQISAALNVKTTFTLSASQDAIGARIVPTFTEPGSGTASLYAGLHVLPAATAGAGNITDFAGIDIGSLTAQTGTTTASGLRVAAPSGANSNWAIKVLSGDVNLAGSGSALATGATTGFTHIPSCAGTPTGVPGNTTTGAMAVIGDTTNNRLWFYNSGWKTMGVKSIQYGTVTIAGGAASGTASISSVDTAKTVLQFLGASSTGANTDADNFNARITLTNATTITATRNGTGANGVIVGFCAVEYF